MKFAVALACLVSVASACVDKQDNVVAFSDCGGSNALAKFSGLQAYTYDGNGNPTCKTNSAGKLMGDVQLPGGLLIAKGSLTITGNPGLSSGTKLALTFGKLNSLLAKTVCSHGKSQVFLIPDEVCNLPFCQLVSQTLCDKINAGGSFTIQDLPAVAKRMIHLPELKGVLSALNEIIKGEWSLQGDIIQGGDIACIKNADIPFNE